MSLEYFLEKFNSQNFEDFNAVLQEKIKEYKNYEKIFPVLRLCRDLLENLPASCFGQIIELSFDYYIQGFSATSNTLQQEETDLINIYLSRYDRFNNDSTYKVKLDHRGVEEFKKELLGEHLYILYQHSKMQLDLPSKMGSAHKVKI